MGHAGETQITASPKNVAPSSPLRSLEFVLPDHHKSADVDVEMPPRRAPVAEISAPTKVVLPGKQQDVPPPPSARRLIPRHHRTNIWPCCALFRAYGSSR